MESDHSFGSLKGSCVIFIPDTDQLHGVQEVVEGVGAVPEFVLLPEAGGHREEEEFIQVRGFGGQEAGRASGEVGPLSPKKPSRVQRATCRVSFRALTASYSSSLQDHSPICITGW